MTPADKPEFGRILLGLSLMYDKDLKAELVELWWNAMHPWPIEDFRAAANQLMRTSKFMPRVVDFEQLRKANRPTADDAWLKARAVAKDAVQLGRYTNHGLTTGNDRIDAAVRAIGNFTAIAACPIDQMYWLQKRFAEAYEQVNDITDTREALPEIASPPAPTRIRREEPVAVADKLPPVAKATAASQEIIDKLKGNVAPNRTKEPRAHKQRTAPAHTEATLRDMAKKLAAIGTDAQTIAKMLQTSNVTLEQVRGWLSPGEPA